MFRPPSLVRRILHKNSSQVADRGVDEVLPARVDERQRTTTRAELLNETLQLANYSAVTHLAVVFALLYMFWGVASQTYLVGLTAAISTIIAATLCTTWYYGNAFRGATTEEAVRRGFWVSKALALALGIVWGTMPALLIAPSDGGHRMVAVATTAGLISDAYVVGPIFSVSILLAAPVVVGAFIGLYGCESPFGIYVSVLLFVYALFVFLSTHRMSLLSYQRIWQRVVMKDQSETIGLLLKDFEEGTSDWLWETDAEGRLRHAPARMAAALGRSTSDIQQTTFQALLREHARPEQSESANEVVSSMLQQVPFSNQAVRLDTSAGPRWWVLNGKPAFDQNDRFVGYRGVGSDTTSAMEAQARIGFLASHDTLTALPNRASFQDTLRQIFDDNSRALARTGLLYCDLDGFKAVNDTSGHGTGDLLLREVASRLTDLAGSGEHVFRLGGDEFAILQACGADDAAEKLAERIVAEIGRPYLIGSQHLVIGISIGIAYAPEDARDPELLLSRADLALYAAKAAGKNCWRGFDPALEERAQRRRVLDLGMREALSKGEMTLFYQPLVHLDDERVAGFEALLRWHKPDEGWISPGEVIPIAEATGFVVDIGRWALRRACLDALNWPGLRVAVNISTMHFRLPGFCEEVEALLCETGLPAACLEIEITESILLDSSEVVLHNLERLRSFGVRMALDDFGTGYSSLSYLTQFPFDKLKIDRSFVADLQTRPEKMALVESIAAMARSLSMEVTVEGVETQQQSAMLRGKRCDTAQGFLYSPARPATEIPDLIKRLNAQAASSSRHPSIAAAA